MKSSHRSALRTAGLGLGLAAGLLPLVASAQRQQGPGPDTKRVLVTTFSGDPVAGVAAANEVRERIAGEYSVRQLMPNPKKDIDNYLTSSGYKVDSALSANDTKELAKLLHADEVIYGRIDKVPAGYRLAVRMFLQRDVSLSQPLGVFESNDFGKLAKMTVDEYDKARKQIPDHQACENGLREAKPAVAIAAARKGLVSYPKSTLLRLCLASAYTAMKTTADSTGPWKDSVIAITKEVIAMDPTSRIAYQSAYDAYKQKGDVENAIRSLVGLMNADPTNSTLRESVIAEIVNSGRADIAVPIAKQLVADNQGDPNFARTYWLVLRSAKNYKESVPAGMALVALDTSYADSNYYDRQIQDLTVDSSFAKAAEMAQMAAAKYPKSTSYLVTAAQNLRRAGQLPAAKSALERALTVDPNTNGANYILAQIAADMGNTADVIKYAKADATTAANKERAGLLVLAAGNKVYQAAVASKSPAEYKKAIPILLAADSINTSSNAQFLAGVSGFQAVAQGTAELQKSHACEDYREASDLLTLASTMIPKNGRVSPEAAGQIMGAIPQLQPFVESSIRRYCTAAPARP